MRQYFVGVDCGSTMCKTVLFDEKNIVDLHSVKTGWNPKLSAEQSLAFILAKNNIKGGDVCLAATGYGREAIDFADCTFTEITCHALGAMFLSPDIGGVIDIGGQDSKVIKLQNSKAVNFLMNDKCAAGTGRFLSMACDTLGISMDCIDQFADQVDPVRINSMCTVFAESEIIGSIAMQKERGKIMAGVLHSIAQKIRQMTAKLDLDPDKPLLMTGGLSGCNTLIKIISQTIGMDVKSHKYATYAGAAGACICAKNKAKQFI